MAFHDVHLRSSDQPEKLKPVNPFSNAPVAEKRRSRGQLQAKLTVNVSDDQLEQEADRIALEVTRTAAPKVQRQRICSNGSNQEDCSECKKKKPRSIGSLQRSARLPKVGVTAPPIVDRVLSSPGSPLPDTARTFMESRFGHDFSHVRVHTDNQAAESAAAVQAKAYTVKNRIVFGYGEHPSNDHFLLAHELTHVLQQESCMGGSTTTGEVSKSAPTIQRYEAGEHAMFGSDEIVNINGVEFTHGELIAMGDFFKTPEQMRAASEKELTQLRALIRKDKLAFSGKSTTKPVFTDEWQSATGNRYLELAEKNNDHFAPRAGDSGYAGANHKARFYELHRQALYQAWFDGRVSGGKVSAAAIGINSFAAHFLTDAFSAGHLVNKSEVVESATNSWNRGQTTGLVFKENAFTKAVAHAAVSDPRSGPKLANHELKMLEWGDITEQRFSEFLWQVAATEPALFFNVFARTVHDELNHAIAAGAANGVEVTISGKSQPFRLSGDGTLSLSPETLNAGREAVAESERNLAAAAKATSEPDFKSFCDGVWKLTPTPTEPGKKQIQETSRDLTDVSKPQSSERVGELTITEIDAAIKRLIEKGYLRPRKPKPSSVVSERETREHFHH